jgi:hypothetical protein
MDSQQIMEFLLAMQAKADANEAKADARHEADQAKAEARHEQIMADWRAWREETATVRDKRVNDKHDEMMACQEIEARQGERKPTSRDRKPEAAQRDEVPKVDAEVMPVGEPKRERRRDRKLAAERRRQEPKCGPQNKLVVARRGTTRRAKVARQMENTYFALTAYFNCKLLLIILITLGEAYKL